MTTRRRAEKYGFYSNLTIFGYLQCARLRQVKIPVVLLNQPNLLGATRVVGYPARFRRIIVKWTIVYTAFTQISAALE